MFNSRVRFNEGAPAGGGSSAAPAAASDVSSASTVSTASESTGNDSGWASYLAQTGIATEGSQGGNQGGTPAAAAPAATAEGSQTAQTNQAGQEGGSSASTPSAEAQRIAQLEQENARYKNFDSVITRLESEGYTNAGAVEAFLTQQQEQNALAAHMSQVETKLMARIEAGTLTEEEALQDYQTEMERQQQVISAQQITTKYAAMQTEQAMSGALAAHPILAVGRSADGKTLGKGESLVRALHRSNPQVDIGRLAEYVAGNLTAIQEQAVAEHAAKQTQQTPPILNGGGSGNGSGGTGAPLSMSQRLLQKAGISFGN